MPEYQQVTPEAHPDIEGQTSILDFICTRDEGCRADVDQHYSDCPVEQRLREEFGF